MKVTIKTSNLDDDTRLLFTELLQHVKEFADKYVHEIIICDSNNLLETIHRIDGSIVVTDIYGVLVLGKTIHHQEQTFIFLISELVKYLVTNLKFGNDGEVILGSSNLSALKTLFHEFGHAKNIFELGALNTKTHADDYEEFLNEHWKILRDEYLAEMFCANINNFTSSLYWYGDFSDEIEAENFLFYAKQYSESDDGLSWEKAFQILNMYYFIPLFQKAGFLDGSKEQVLLDRPSVSKTVTKILNYRVPENIYAPKEFNELVLEKWGEFQVPERLKRAS